MFSQSLTFKYTLRCLLYYQTAISREYLEPCVYMDRGGYSLDVSVKCDEPSMQKSDYTQARLINSRKWTVFAAHSHTSYLTLIFDIQTPTIIWVPWVVNEFLLQLFLDYSEGNHFNKNDLKLSQSKIVCLSLIVARLVLPGKNQTLSSMH